MQFVSQPSTSQQAEEVKMTQPEYTAKTFLNSAGDTWESCLRQEFEKPYFKKLLKFLQEESKTKEIFPRPNLVFKWTTFCSPQDVKVVILGQDPYPNETAQGIAFSVPIGHDIPDSLQNVFKVLEMNYAKPRFLKPQLGDLTSWCEQGVLLLNTSLTVEKGKPNSHAAIWKEFSNNVIQYLEQTSPKCIYLLWGIPAKKLGKTIPDERKLETSHPSHLSAHLGFLKCKHFLEANTYLKNNGEVEINWWSMNGDTSNPVEEAQNQIVQFGLGLLRQISNSRNDVA